MKCSMYFGAKWHGFIKGESILAPKGASRFKTQNIRYYHLSLSSGVFAFVQEYVLGEIMKCKSVKNVKVL